MSLRFGREFLFSEILFGIHFQQLKLKRVNYHLIQPKVTQLLLRGLFVFHLNASY